MEPNAEPERPIEFWRFAVGMPRDVVAAADRAEDWGWDGMLLVDSQNLCGDCYVELARAAMVTDRLRLGTGVTNPRTRHAAVTAAAAATLQRASNGRFVLGLGRGDSSLANLGLAPMPVPELAKYLARLRAYLEGGEVPFDELSGPSDRAVEELGLAGRPHTSRLRWLDHGRPQHVPIEVYATGPRVLKLAGATADRVMVAVGADPERVAWAVDQVRTGAKRSGRAHPPQIGAYVNVVCHPDPDVALSLGQVRIAAHARFSVLHGQTVGPVNDEDRQTLERLHSEYDMNEHGLGSAAHSKQLTEDFVHRFAIFGPPDYCIERLTELRSLGLDHFAVGGPAFTFDKAESLKAVERLSFEVLPAFR